MRAGLLLAVFGLCAGAAAAPASRIPDAAALEQARAEARQAAERAGRLELQARRATGQAQRARVAAAAATARIEAAEAGLTAAERRISIVARLQSRHRARLAERQRPLVRLTAALQVMARRPAALALVQPGSMDNIVRVRSLLAATLPEIRRRTTALRADMERSEALGRQARQARGDLLASREDLQRRRAELAAFESAQRARSRTLAGLALTESDRALVLGEEARGLARVIGTRGHQARLAASLAALPTPLPRPGSGAEVHSSESIPYRLPVEGRLRTGVGEISDGGVHARGLTFATAAGARIVAPARGRVLHAAPFRRYRYVVIIDHGRGWMTVITDLATARVSSGQTVRAGDLLGFAGDGQPQVTVELRRDGRPVPLAQFVAA
ncbi:MAG TPA: peptidoglycan DD-metalloendopeptidase family protein [Allosphingosinicella sp.]|nr:peptidoglycan DD-metalloendopeptidase family protein [Allosphingosinicella sp.]